MNKDRAKRASDKRRAIIADMRRTVEAAMSGRDEPPDFNGRPSPGGGSEYNGMLQPASTPVDRTGASDRMAYDAGLGARGRMLNNMRGLLAEHGWRLLPRDRQRRECELCPEASVGQ